jgi:hypothetical protein
MMEEFWFHVRNLRQLRRSFRDLALSPEAMLILAEFDEHLDRILREMLEASPDEAVLLAILIKASDCANRLAEENEELGGLAGLFATAWAALLEEIEGPLSEEELIIAQVRGFDRFLPQLQERLELWFRRN